MNDTLPEVYATNTGTVVLDLQPDQAEVLARVLSHYDVLAARDPLEGYVPEVWHHTFVQLLVQRAHAIGSVAEAQMVQANQNVVDALTDAGVYKPRHLALVGGDQ